MCANSIMPHMSIYGPEYAYFQASIDRVNKPSRRIYDTLRHVASVAGLVRPGDRVLDVGSGIGVVGHDLRWLGIQTTSIDVSTYAQKVGVKLFGSETRNLRVVGDAVSLPFADDSFDLSTSWELFEHLDISMAAMLLNELSRVTRRNRLFVKLTPTEDVSNIDQDPTHVTKWSESAWTEWFGLKG